MMCPRASIHDPAADFLHPIARARAVASSRANHDARQVVHTALIPRPLIATAARPKTACGSYAPRPARLPTVMRLSRARIPGELPHENL